MKYIGSCGRKFGSAYGVHVIDRYAYVISHGEERDLFWVVDVSDPKDPREIWMRFLPGGTRGFYVSGNYAYAAIRNLWVMDLSDPENPKEVAFHDFPYYSVAGVHVSGNYAYIANGGSGLRIMDISNPENLREVGFYDTVGQATGVYVFDDYIYVTTLEGGLHILELSNL